MKKNSKNLLLLNLFFIMFKIGLFTFGGGYAMLALLEDEFVGRKKWLTEEEFMDMTAIAESTPGPIAINSSTYIGYKICGFAGSVFATISICLPSFIIIFIISLFFDAFLELTFVSYAFKGIRACVVYLILSAGIKMFKGLKRNIFSSVMFGLTLIISVTLYILSADFSSVFYILIGGVAGIIIYSLAPRRNKGGKGK